jgi:hypothetical protein
MTYKLPKVCVIILSWNHKKDVLENIKSLQASNQNGFTMQISIVDNGSTDGTVEELAKLNIKVKKLDKNYGFVKGNNVGIKEALDEGFDYIAVLNDDTVVDANLIRNILLEHQKNNRAGAISPKIYFAKGFEFHKRYKDSDLGHVIWYAGGLMDWKNIYGSNRGVDEIDHGQYDKTEETDFATGCFVMYKAKTLKEVGLFDEKYFAYMEDVDLSQRIKKAGWRVLYSSKGFLWHKVSQSSGIGSQHNDYYLTRNRMLFGLEYASFRTKLALIRESIKLLLNGREWQKVGIRDYYLGRFGKGSWK